MMKYYTTNSYHVNRNFIFFSPLLYFSSFFSCTRPKGGMKMQVDRVNFADIPQYKFFEIFEFKSPVFMPVCACF